MAAHETTEYSTADGNDYAAHEATYERFVFLVFIGIMHVINVTLGLAVGGVKGAWWTAAAIFIAATVVAIHGLATGAKVPSSVMLVISLAALAFA